MLQHCVQTLYTYYDYNVWHICLDEYIFAIVIVKYLVIMKINERLLKFEKTPVCFQLMLACYYIKI